jgi:excisionase family DNA binding protein
MGSKRAYRPPMRSRSRLVDMTAAKLQHIWPSRQKLQQGRASISSATDDHAPLKLQHNRPLWFTQMLPVTTPPLTAADVLSASEVANLLGVPISTVHEWARRGLLPSRKIGRRRLFIRSKIEALLMGGVSS